MNKKEFFAALRRALAALPDEERDNVIKYYEDYFLDAEGESDEEIIRGLGDPQKIAEDILRDYRELQPRSGSSASGGAKTAARRTGISPWLLIVLVLLAVPTALLFGIPLAGGLLGVIVGLVGAVVGVIVAAVVTLAALPAGLVLAGLALCFFSFFVWATPASAVLTLGVGLVLLAAGGLVALLIIKILRLVVPPVCRGIVNGIRWICGKIRGVFR